MKKLLTVYIFIFWFVSIASAGELITGAFGIKLGKPLDLNLVKGEILDTGWDPPWNGSKKAEVKPKILNKHFDTYETWLTPTTKIVVGVRAYGHREFCGSEDRGLEENLNNKYGKSFSDKSSRLYLIWEDSKGRRVHYGCHHNPYSETAIFSILYKGSKEEIDEISKERKKLDIESADLSGL